MATTPGSSFWRNKTFVTVVMAVSLFAVTLVARELLDNRTARLSARWLEMRRPAPLTSVAIVPIDSVAVLPEILAYPIELQRIRAQLATVRGRLFFHFDIIQVFYRFYSTSLILSAVAGLVAAAMLLLISKGGWDAAALTVRVTFIIATGVAAGFGASPSFFRHGENITANEALCTAHENLEGEILSYFATRTNAKGMLRAPNEFIHDVDSTLAAINRISIGFDPSKLPTGSQTYGNVP